METENFQIYKLDLEKVVEPEIKLPTSVGPLKKQENSRKISASASLTTLKPLTMRITTNWKVLQEMGIPGHLTCETCVQVRKQQLESDMEQQTGSKLVKEYIKAVYCHSACLTYMQSISCEMLDWMNHKLESSLPGELSTTSDMQMILL